jgi:hypothetical protein
MSARDVLLHGTVWTAMAAWAAAEACSALGPRRPRDGGAAATTAVHGRPGLALPDAPRILWTIGALSLAAHLAAAMQFRHGWSHTAAVAETARQTEAKFGMNWGGGVWFNYAMILLWTADAVCSWAAPTLHDRPSTWRRSVNGFFLFMWFNGAVVFPSGPVRWSGAIACAVVLAAWWWTWKREKDPPTTLT